jgi:paraquat-inducible protein B
MEDKLQALENSTQAKFEDVTKTLDEVKAKGESTNEMVQDISRKLAFLDGADAMKERLKDRQYEQHQLSLGKIAAVASLASGAFGSALAIVWEVSKLLISSLSKGVPPHG